MRKEEGQIKSGEKELMRKKERDRGSEAERPARRKGLRIKQAGI